MFNGKFKLICSAIGLVAVLVMGLAMPGTTQQIELPTRAQIVKGLSQLIATLTTGEGDILDVENTLFLSFPVVTYYDDGTFQTTSSATLAQIPLHPTSRSVQRLFDWLIKDEPFGESLYIGALYVSEDLVGCSNYDRLTAGIYHLKVLSDLRVVAVDAQGNEFFVGYFSKEKLSRSQELSLEVVSPFKKIVGGILIILCLIPGEQICTTETICTTVTETDENGNVRIRIVCVTTKKCYGC